jgi:leucyl aminopeptidase
MPASSQPPRTETMITTIARQNADTLALTVFDGGKLGPEGQEMDKALKGWLSHCLAGNAQFKGKSGQVFSFPCPPHFSFRHIVLLGAGRPEALDRKSCELLGAPLHKALAAAGGRSATVVVDRAEKLGLDHADAAAYLAAAAQRAAYDFTKYKTGVQKPFALQKLNIFTTDWTRTKIAHAKLEAVNGGVRWAADLGNEPGNVLYPDAYAREIAATLAPLGVRVTVLDEHDMKKLGMNAALAVGQGSTKPPRMVVMEYDGTNGAQKRPLALVGKGVTFDTGGISIKPAAGMQDMKFDMCGSAAVVGTMQALAARKAKAHVVSIVGLAENMPGGNAVKPGDIVTSMNGKTIEITNTDAEGRLVLADALTYIQRRHNPHTVIDLATLTGAIVVALGNTYSGVFANDDKLWKRLDKAGGDAGEPGWRMPLHRSYADAMRGKYADLDNSGGGRMGGSCTAAGFLHQFVEKKKDGGDACKWAHIDIAGTAMPAYGVGTGYGVRMLERLIADNYEEKDGPRAPKPVHVPKP